MTDEKLLNVALIGGQIALVGLDHTPVPTAMEMAQTVAAVPPEFRAILQNGALMGLIKDTLDLLEEPND